MVAVAVSALETAGAGGFTVRTRIAGPVPPLLVALRLTDTPPEAVAAVGVFALYSMMVTTKSGIRRGRVRAKKIKRGFTA